MSSNNWKQHYANLASNEDGDRNMKSFSLAMAAGASLQTKIQNLVEEIDTVFIVANDEKKLQLIHSPMNLGGTRTRVDNKIVCLIEMGSQATPVILDFEKALADRSIVTPTIDDILNCGTKEDILDLECPDQPEEGSQDGVTFPGSSAFIPAPWLRDQIANSDSLDGLDLIPSIIAAAKRFDEDHHEDASFTSDAINHAEDFALWAYGVSLGLIPESRFKINPEDGELVSFGKRRHEECLLPPALPNGGVATGGSIDDTAVLAQLNSTMARQTEEAETANNLRRKEIERQEEKEERKKDKIKDLHISIRNMLTLASSADCDDTPLEPAESCKGFFNCKNSSQAEQELIQQFQDIGLDDVAFAQGTSQALYHGQFQFYQGSTPSNFTIFGFYEQDPLQMDKIDKRSLLLTLVSARGQGDTLEEIKNSAKQTVRVPKTFEGLRNQLLFFEGAISIFFGDDSVPRGKMSDFIESMMKRKTIYKAAIVNDEAFPAKVMYAIDIRFQRWLAECKRASDRCEVDDRIIDLSEIGNDICNSRFFVNLPPSFSRPHDSIEDEKPSGSGGAQGGGRKRKSDKDEKDGNKKKQVQNDDQIEEFKLKDGESWRNDFCGKCVDFRPTWKGMEKVKMCPRWHTKGDCFEDCRHKESHVGSSEVNDREKTEYKKYLKKVRSE